MKKNLNLIDRLIRLLLAAILTFLYLTGIATGALGITLLVVAGIIAITAFISFCPIYFLFGLSSKRK